MEYRNPARIKSRVEAINHYPFHLHEDSIEIICILCGSAVISDAAARYELKSGDVHIFNRECPHRISSEASDNLILTVQLDRSHYQRFFPELENTYFLCDTNSDRNLSGNDMLLLRFYLALIYSAYSENSRDQRLEKYAKKLLDLLLTHFCQYKYIPEEGNPATIVRLQNQDHFSNDYKRMDRIADYVEKHFNEPLRLKDIAEAEYLSCAHLSRLLKNNLGLPFSQFLSLVRCEEAARMLSSSRNTIDEIAEKTGFANRKHLAVQFKKWYDRNPSEYRNSIISDLHSEASVTRIQPDDPRTARIIERYLEEY